MKKAAKRLLKKLFGPPKTKTKEELLRELEKDMKEVPVPFLSRRLHHPNFNPNKRRQ